MSSNLEFKGKSVDEAVKAASESLGIPREELDYKVLSYGSTGIFGLVGAKKALISVKLSEPREDREGYKEPREKFSEYKKLDSDEPKNTGYNVLRQIVNFITDGADISVTEETGRIIYDIRGGNSAVLIGKRGQTLDAIHYLVEKMVNRKSFERIRVDVDVEGYLRKKRVGLESLALRLAEKTKRTGRPSTIGLMNGHERKIIHIALRGDRDIRTKSIGEGFLRKMVIVPYKNPYGSQYEDDFDLNLDSRDIY